MLTRVPSSSRNCMTLVWGGRISAWPRSAKRRCSTSFPTRNGSRNRNARFSGASRAAVFGSRLDIGREGADGAVTRTVAGPGAVVPIAGGREHTIRNEANGPAAADVVFSPREAMERFARAAAALEDPLEVLALAEAHGIEMTRSTDD